MGWYTCNTHCLPSAGPTTSTCGPMCRNIQPSFGQCLCIQKVCLGFKRFHRNVNIKYFKKSKNSEKNKIMIWGIHYFITKLKTKIDVIPRNCFKRYNNISVTTTISSWMIIRIYRALWMMVCELTYLCFALPFMNTGSNECRNVCVQAESVLQMYMYRQPA